MVLNTAECYRDDHEGSDGDKPQACSDDDNGLSCIEYDYEMGHVIHKTAHTRHVWWRVGSGGVKKFQSNGFNINEDNPVALE